MSSFDMTRALLIHPHTYRDEMQAVAAYVIWRIWNARLMRIPSPAHDRHSARTAALQQPSAYHLATQLRTWLSVHHVATFA